MRKYSIDFVGFSTSKGGAAIAAKRIFSAIKGKVSTRFYCMDMNAILEENVYSPSKLYWITNFSLRLIEFFFLRALYPRSPVKVSLNIFGSSWIKRKVFESGSDVVYIQWVNNNTLSLNSIGRLIQSNKPTIIHLHDEWLFNGVFHISPSVFGYKPRFLGGYIDQIFLSKKKKMLNAAANTSFVVPSIFLKERLIERFDIERNNVYVVPNPLPIDFFKRTKNVERESIEEKIKLLLPSFCPKLNPNKSTDLAIASIEYYAESNPHLNVEVLSFGDYDAGEFTAPNVQHKHLGYVGCDDLIDAIDASHLTLVLSKFETFGQVAAESMARGTPVIARSSTAISELITHKREGYLVEESDVETIAQAIEWFRTNKHYEAVRLECRAKVEALLNVADFENLYFKILNEFYYES